MFGNELYHVRDRRFLSLTDSMLFHVDLSFIYVISIFR